MTALMDVTAVAALSALLVFMTRSAAGTISVSHQRPWLRHLDVPQQDALEQ